jgi:protein-S-isoprenylcysteine O-methyltransferase Ste14
MIMREIKFWLAPIGVAIGITLFITVSVFAVRAIGISSVQAIVPFIPYSVLATMGAVFIVLWLPLFVSGIYYLGRRGAVGQSKQLITQGIYRYVRNPMYSGLSMTILGVGLLLNSMGVALAGILWLAMTVVQCKREEKELTKRFGESYREYKKRTHLFLPGFIKMLKSLKQ